MTRSRSAWTTRPTELHVLVALAEAESWYRLRGLAEPMPIGLPSATRRGWRERGRVALAVAGAVVCVLAVVVAYVLVVRQLSDLPL